MSFDSAIAYRRLARAWHEHYLPRLEDAMTTEDKAGERWTASALNWLEEHARPVRAALARVERLGLVPSDRTTIQDWPRVEAHLRDVLDLAPPGDKARQVFRPMWPMTLDQLRAMVADAGEPKKNPAPLIDRKKFPRERSHVYGAGRVMYLGPDHSSLPHPDSASDSEGIDGIAWQLSAPEGFPPTPRRGGVYSRDEAAAVQSWLLDRWPAVVEARAIAREKDAERALAGIEPEAVTRVIRWSSFDEPLRDELYSRSQHGLPDPEGKSPKELLAAVLEWAGRSFLPLVDAIEHFDIALLSKWADPDAHMRALRENYLTKYREVDVAKSVYHLTNYTAPWTEKLVGKQEKPDRLLETYSDVGQYRSRKLFPLSVLLAAQAAADVAYRKRLEDDKREGERAKAQALPILRAMLAKGHEFSRANVTKALPSYELYSHAGPHSVSVHLRAPGGANIAHGSGRTVTAAMTDLRRSLGVK